MKKFTVPAGLAMITGLITLFSSASAQISITQADMPSVGLIVTTDKDSTTMPPPGNPSATAQSWAFGTLMPEKTRTVAFMAPSSTPWASYFTPANLADSTYGEYGYDFFSITPGAFAVEGSELVTTYSSIPIYIKINLSPMFVQSNLPATYGSNLSGVGFGEETFYQYLYIYDSLMVHAYFIYSDTVDAWGSMTLPNGTFNVLRQKHYEEDIDSVWAYSILSSSWGFQTALISYKNQYDWYTNGQGYILAEMDMDTAFANQIDVIWDNSAVATGINQLSASSGTSVYPNPCSSEINFRSTAQTEQYLSVYDVTGRKLDQIGMLNGLSSLNTSLYSNGIYFYQLTDNNGALLDKGKFSVQK